MGRDPPARLLGWSIAALVLAGAGLRVFRLGEQVIIDDEWHALNIVQDRDAGYIFSHFGHADHSIPLALLYELQQHSIGLSEWALRWPSVVAGIALLLVFPWLLRRWLKDLDWFLLTGLLAVSPFLVNFSRIARPYALLALLAASSLVLAWVWWKERRTGPGVAWASCAVLAGWMNPVSLAVTTAPIIWFLVDGLREGIRGRGWRDFGRVMVVGVAVAIPLALLLYQPIASDFASLAVKSGKHQMTFQTLVVMLSLYAGFGQNAAVAAVALFAAIGVFALWRRDRAFTCYLALIAVAALSAVWQTGAAWIHQGLVPARYLIGLLPFFLALVAIGAGSVIERLLPAQSPPDFARTGAALAALVLLFASGPIPTWDLRHSQFAHHLIHQFDFKASRNDFREVLAWVQPEAFYEEIASLHPAGEALVVEAPWHLESHYNPLVFYQQVHRQRVKVGFVGGVCAGRLYGELRPDATGMAFRNFIRLGDLLKDPGQADYLVLRKRDAPDARKIDFDFDQCARVAIAAFGEPWRTTENALVFRLNADA